MLDFTTISLLMLLLSVSFVMFCIFWYLFVTDRNFILAFAEKFGKSMSYYNSKVVWITGASSGLGESMAYELASVGAKLILTARRTELLQNIKDTCLSKSKGQLTENDILVLPFDITELGSHEKHVDSALAHFGKVDILVNNAAQAQIGNIHSTSIELIKNLFEVNVFGGICLTQLLLKHFLERNEGQLIIISSIGGKMGNPCLAPYAATKHALQGFYDSLRIEYNNENIKVTIVNPGIFRSGMQKATILPTGIKVNFDNVDYINRMPSKRCAYLTLIAGANNLYEAWISYPPHLFSLLIAQHLPDIIKYIHVNLIWTKSRLNTFLSGKLPEIANPRKPLFLNKCQHEC